MKTTTFSITNNITPNNTFRTTNYSAILDDLISSNIKETNKYLNMYEDITKSLNNHSSGTKTFIIGSSCPLKSNTFATAANFLSTISKKNAKMPFIFGKIYKLIDGTPIIFYDDEIQIGFDLYSYSDFADTLFLKSLTPATKKTIINIYTTGRANIDININ